MARRQVKKKTKTAKSAKSKVAKKVLRKAAPKRAARKPVKKAVKKSPGKAAKTSRKPLKTKKKKPSRTVARTARTVKKAVKKAGKKPAARKAAAPKAAKKTARAAARPTAKKAAKKTVRKTAPAPAVMPAVLPRLDRERRRLPEAELEEFVGTGDDQRLLRSARSGHDELRSELKKHTESNLELTAGDVDANWQDAYAIGDEAPGGDSPTPDQDRVDDIGKALGVVYDDDEELMGGDEIAERDVHRWELDPASKDDDEEL
jgi:hypothetical protein